MMWPLPMITVGTEMLAGYGIGSRLEFLLIPITFAFGIASVPMVGVAIGAGHVKRARRVAWTAAAASGLTVGLIGLAVALAPSLWVGLFTRDPGVTAAAYSYFHWAGPAFVFFGMGVSLYFSSQGAARVGGRGSHHRQPVAPVAGARRRPVRALSRPAHQRRRAPFPGTRRSLRAGRRSGAVLRPVVAGHVPA